MTHGLRVLFHDKLVVLSVALLLLSAGLTVVTFFENQKIAKAATGAAVQFSSTWTAKTMLHAKLAGITQAGSPVTFPIGVDSWSVVGATGTTTFNETWTAEKFAFLSDGTGVYAANLGCPTNINGYKRLQPYDTGGTDTSITDAYSIAGAVGLGWTTRITPTGQYGWMCWFLGQTGMDSKSITSGSAIPTKWTVVGSYTSL